MPDQEQQPVTLAQFERALGLLAETIAAEFSQTREEIGRRFELNDRRLTAIESHLDRVSDTAVGILAQLAAVTRGADRNDRTQREIIATQTAQQQAIDDLARRLREIEAKLKPAA